MQLSTIVKVFVFITFGVSTTVAGPILPTVDDEPAYDCKHKGNFDPKLANKAKASCSNHMHTHGLYNPRALENATSFTAVKHAGHTRLNTRPIRRQWIA
ncbi:hypothetical protein MGG_08432 [Pyricularia oryzae 70-15]|uniref:Uncharacterized protein n=1 Tax=Pyricularia oryzae (strain 70-15 / ATCC MYA-4617 / FGSC 8958) TaxID=242507 RepID=G4NA64_PYRO7|nr:uncharacterized protein MGG_08432 [Pyricularia oryzae 70-15]EHA49614.1 hypothetical protein MGG_08432 [Pyricularia oryzae 70-15]